MLLRHPNGKSVVDDAYNAATAGQRAAMAAEFYGRQFTLFEVPLLAILHQQPISPSPACMSDPRTTTASGLGCAHVGALCSQPA